MKIKNEVALPTPAAIRAALAEFKKQKKFLTEAIARGAHIPRSRTRTPAARIKKSQKGLATAIRNVKKGQFGWYEINELLWWLQNDDYTGITVSTKFVASILATQHNKLMRSSAR